MAAYEKLFVGVVGALLLHPLVPFPGPEPDGALPGVPRPRGSTFAEFMKGDIRAAVAAALAMGDRGTIDMGEEEREGCIGIVTAGETALRFDGCE